MPPIAQTAIFDSKAQPCADCGWQAGQDYPPPALALGRIFDDRYCIGRLLGHGGGRDHLTCRGSQGHKQGHDKTKAAFNRLGK
jgi:hypothetical protein